MSMREIPVAYEFTCDGCGAKETKTSKSRPAYWCDLTVAHSSEVKMQSETKAKALEQFTDYFVKNYPGPDTIIYDPKWHAPKIFAAAHHAITAALSEQAVEVSIKPLEWEASGGDGTMSFRATAIGLRYYVYLNSDDGRWHAYTEGYQPESFGEFFTREGAILAVKAAHEKRVRSLHIASSALVDVPAIEPVGDDLIGYVLRYGGMCRDCADMDGVCQSGQPCDTDQRRAVVKHTVAALAYGIKHGFIANPFASPPLSREGADSVEVERLRDALERISDGYGPNHLSAFCRNTSREALAATRSGSATAHSGGEHG